MMKVTKSVFFHEFLHAITLYGENSGFYEAWGRGDGFNEGFTQMMTLERDRKIANKEITNGSYLILTQSCRKIL